MDEELRRLERLANLGDPQAKEALKQRLIRARQLIPNDAEIEQMGCGFAVGTAEALPLFVELWFNILIQLFNNFIAALEAAATDIEHPINEFTVLTGHPEDAVTIDGLTFQRNRIYSWRHIALALDPEDPNLWYKLLDHFEEPVAYLNILLEASDKFPIYLNANEITRSLTVAFTAAAYEVYYFDLPIFKDFPDRPTLHDLTGIETYRFTPKVYTTIRHIRGENEVEFEWNVGNYTPNHQTRDILCNIDFFQNLPCVLQEYPVWKRWGYGKCNDSNYQDRYQPIDHRSMIQSLIDDDYLS